jgi:transposase-like protein
LNIYGNLQAKVGTLTKAKIVLELISGQKSQAEICRDNQLSPQLLTNWKDTFLENASNAFPSKGKSNPEQGRINDLEQALGRATLENEILAQPWF